MHKNSRVKSDNDLISVSLASNPCFQTCGGGFAVNTYGREAPFLFSLPRVGKAAIREQRYPRHKAFPLPREEACVDTPSFLWKEVGWG